MWRGSLVYRLYISAPVGVTGKMRIRWQPEGWLPIATVSSADAGDVQSLTVDFKGDTIVDLTIPPSNFVPFFVLPKNMAAPVWDGTNCNGYLVVSLVNSVQNPYGVNVIVNTLVTMCVGDDMEYYGLRDTTGITYQASEEMGHEALTLMDAVSVDSGGICNLQRYHSFKERWMLPRVNASLSTCTLDPRVGHPDESRTFCGFRGTRVLYSLMTGSKPTLRVYQVNTSGDVLLHNEHKHQYLQGHTLGWSLPYTCNVPYIPFTPEPPFSGTPTGYVVTTALCDALSTAYQYECPGDDAQWFIPAWPPQITMAT
jgi:hypothetical protein